MKNITINDVQILLDTRTTEKWGEVSRKIPKGFACVELTEDGKVKLKIGDGVNTFADLPYVGGEDADLSDYYNKQQTDEKIEEIVEEAISEKGDLFTLKGTVETTGKLPPSDNSKGDVYLVGEESGSEFEEYYWTGEKWDYMGTTTSVDLEEYAKTAEVEEKITEATKDLISKDDVLILNCTLPEE